MQIHLLHHRIDVFALLFLFRHEAQQDASKDRFVESVLHVASLAAP
jgi:hypothetical protein